MRRQADCRLSSQVIAIHCQVARFRLPIVKTRSREDATTRAIQNDLLLFPTSSQPQPLKGHSVYINPERIRNYRVRVQPPVAYFIASKPQVCMQSVSMPKPSLSSSKAMSLRSFRFKHLVTARKPLLCGLNIC